MKNTNEPPRLAKKIIEWYCRNAQVEDLLGDMTEMYRREAKEMSVRRAQHRYWRQVTSLIFSYTVRRRRKPSSPRHEFFNFNMLGNYFIVARRTMTKNKAYTVINVLGLTLGISACLIVYLIVSHEFSFDRFHADRERIYRLRTIQPHEDQVWQCVCVPAPAFPTLRDEFAGAEAITGYHHYSAFVTITEKGEEKNFDRTSGKMIITDPAYFSIFQYQWLAGNPAAMEMPRQVVLTESRAHFYFGNEPVQNIVGRTMIYNDSLQMTVAGVVKDWTEHSDFIVTDFISFSTIDATFLKKEIFMQNWGALSHSSQGFIKLKEGSDPKVVSEQITAVIKKNSTEPMSLALDPLADLHFNNNEEAAGTVLPMLYTITGLAGFILVIASINFINLSTAQSIRRMREIGIRKAMGSQRKQIVFQFLSETLVLSVIAVVLSLLILRPLLDLFAAYIPQGITMNLFQVSNWLFIGGLMLFVSVLAGIYPALVVSSYRPAVSLLGKIASKGRERFSLRKGLIVFQFAVSLFFIIATFVISRQLDFIHHSDKGFSTADVMTFRTNWTGKVSTVKMLGEKLRLLPGVEEVALQNFNPMGFAMRRNSIVYDGQKGRTEVPDVSLKSGDEHYIPLYGIRLKAGRNLTPGDSVRELIINETLLGSMGLTAPAEALGEKIALFDQEYTIVGVAANFHELSFRNAIGPTVIGAFDDQFHAIALRISDARTSDTKSIMVNVEKEFSALYPEERFDYHSIEDEIGWMHGAEDRTASLARIAMVITVFISCIGLFGLAMFTSEMRTREIGIRKVLGASVVNISTMLTGEFLTLIVVAFLLASPVAWYVMHDWLLGFTFRVEMTVWVFLLAGSCAIAIGLVAVSFQSVRAAMGNPVRALRAE